MVLHVIDLSAIITSNCAAKSSKRKSGFFGSMGKIILKIPRILPFDEMEQVYKHGVIGFNILFCVCYIFSMFLVHCPCKIPLLEISEENKLRFQ